MPGKQHSPKNVRRRRVGPDNSVKGVWGAGSWQLKTRAAERFRAGSALPRPALAGSRRAKLALRGLGPNPSLQAQAKQSISPRKERMDCFVASALARRRASADKSASLRKRFAFVAGNDEPSRYAPAPFLFCRCSTRSSTTAGSASVEVSPRLPGSSSAILRRMRRMILPERVFGNPGAN